MELSASGSMIVGLRGGRAGVISVNFRGGVVAITVGDASGDRKLGGLWGVKMKMEDGGAGRG